MSRSNLKRGLLVTGLGLTMMSLAGQSLAACTDATRINSAPVIVALLAGKTVCVPAVTIPDMTWQELHQGATAAGGALVDYKRGPGHAIDPSEPVGTWSVDTSNGGNQPRVIHNYGTGGTYTYSVHNNGNNTYSFCSAQPEVIAAIRVGPGCSTAIALPVARSNPVNAGPGALR